MDQLHELIPPKPLNFVNIGDLHTKTVLKCVFYAVPPNPFPNKPSNPTIKMSISKHARLEQNQKFTWLTF